MSLQIDHEGFDLYFNYSESLKLRKREKEKETGTKGFNAGHQKVRPSSAI